MASSDARPVPRKNTAFRVTFPIMDNDGDLVTGAAGLDSEVSKDGAAFADCTNEATEIGSSGVYYLDLTSTEMNADTVALIVKTSTTDAKTSPIIMYPAVADDIPTGTTIAAAVMASVIEGTYTVTQGLRAMMAALLGKASGMGTTSAVFRDTGNSKNRISATVDANGNRSAVTLDVT